MTSPVDPIEHAMKTNDPRPLAEMDREHLEKLRIAEEILEARYHAHRRASRFATWSAALVGYVALAGFFANAWQNYLNKTHLSEQAAAEKERWAQEFVRGERADKYKAFFQISQLVTDSANSDRRLIGYALMDDFVADSEYHSKAIAILEQSLNRELRDSAGEPPVNGLSEPHRIAVQQIVLAMSSSQSCREVAYAAKSIGGIVQHARQADIDETTELFALYARRLIGRATVVCHEMKDFDTVRQPIREALKRVPDVADLTSSATDEDLNKGLAALLVNACVAEQSDIGSPDCVEIKKKFQALCEQSHRDAKEWPLEEKSCAVVAKWPDPPPSAIQAAATPE